MEIYIYIYIIYLLSCKVFKFLSHYKQVNLAKENKYFNKKIKISIKIKFKLKNYIKYKINDKY